MSLLDNPYGLKPRQSSDDIYRLLAFGFVMIALFLGYDTYVQKPQMEAMKARQAAITSPQATIIAPLPRADALAVTPVSDYVMLENTELKAGINLTGARFDNLILQKYFEELDNKTNVALLSPNNSINPELAQFGWLPKDASIVVPDNNTRWTASDVTAQSVTLSWTSPQNVTFVQKIKLDDRALFTVERSVNNKSGKEITVYPYGRIAREGIPPKPQASGVLHEGLISYVNGKLTQNSWKKMDKAKAESFETGDGWVGITEKYWLAAILNPPASGPTDFRFVTDKGSYGRPLYQVDTRGAAQTIANGATAQNTQYAFIGPKVVDLLDRYSKELNVAHFDLAVDFGRFYFLTRPFFALLHILSGWVGSFAIGLLLTSLVIRACTFPLANTTYRSFAKLRKLAPQMKDLKEKYAADRQKLQQEIMVLYQREKVNPAAGCFPMLLQIPIFFALYKVLFITIEMRHAPFFGWVQDMSAPDPTSIFNLFGLIPWDPPQALMIGAWPAIYCCTMLLLQRLQPPPAEASQRTMMAFMPFMFTFMLAHFPAGMVIYWCWSNLLSLIQQTIIMKSMGVDVHLFHSKKHKIQDVEIFDKKDDVVLQTVEATEIPNPTPDLTLPKRSKKKK